MGQPRHLAASNDAYPTSISCKEEMQNVLSASRLLGRQKPVPPLAKRFWPRKLRDFIYGILFSPCNDAKNSFFVDFLVAMPWGRP
jgi:hypothetical protein